MKTLVLLLLLLSISPCKTSEEIGIETAQATGVYELEEELGEEERGISGELVLDGSYDAQGALSRLWKRILDTARDQLHQELRFALSILAVAFLSSAASVVIPGQKGAEYLEIAACCTVALLLAGSVDSIVGQAGETLNHLRDYAKISMPAFFGTVAACGAAASASVKFASASLATELFMELTQRFILPVIYAYLALSVSSSVFDNAILQTAIRCAKWGAVTAMTALTTGLCAYITLSGVISGSADAAAVKTTKTLIATMLPVVGGILSDSASAMLAAAGLIKNSAGVFCLIAVCAICAGSFAVLSIKMLVLKGTAAMSDLAGSGRLSKLLNHVGSVFGMLLGLIGCYGMMLFLTIMSGIRMVNP